MPKFARVPVKINGQDLGMAQIEEDGSMQIQLKASEIGQELLQFLENGAARGLVLTPILRRSYPGGSD